MPMFAIMFGTGDYFATKPNTKPAIPKLAQICQAVGQPGCAPETTMESEQNPVLGHIDGFSFGNEQG